MSGLRWTDNYSIGVPKIDDEHKNVIDMINNAYAAFKETENGDAAWDIINEMKKYASTHFLTEEKYMLEQAYPQADAHKTEHQYFIEKIKHYEKAQEDQDLNPTELYRFLSSWLISHIMNCDKKLGSFLIEKGIR